MRSRIAPQSREPDSPFSGAHGESGCRLAASTSTLQAVASPRTHEASDRWLRTLCATEPLCSNCGGDTMYSRHVAPVCRPVKRSAQLLLEALETRWCSSCTVTVDGDTLRIIGDAANNTVAIVDNGAAGIVVTCD